MEKMIFCSYVAKDETNNELNTIVFGEFDDNRNLYITNKIDGAMAERYYQFMVSAEDRADEDMLICYIYDDDENDKYNYEMKVVRFDPTVFTQNNGDLTVLSISHYVLLDDEIIKTIIGGKENE